MRSTNRNAAKYTAVVLALLLISVAYAVLNTRLDINGTITAKTNSWNVHFANIVLNSNSVSDELPILTETNTKITFNVSLDNPGDLYEFTVDEVNEGTIDAMIETIVTTPNSEDLPSILDINIRYSDDTPIRVHDLLESGESETITVTVKYKTDIEASDLPSTNGNTNFSLSLIYVQATDEAHTVKHNLDLYNLMKTSANKTKVIDFNTASSSDETHNGIFVTNKTNTGNEIYYYRGNVNNNIVFNNICWKIMRTTDDKGIKLLYNGPYDEWTMCDNTGSKTHTVLMKYNEIEEGTKYDNAHVGYMYGTPNSDDYNLTHENINDSAVKDYLENTWFENNMLSVLDRLEDEIYCNDRSTTDATLNSSLTNDWGTLGYNKNVSAYASVNRSSQVTTNLNPTLICTNANDKFTVSTSNGNGKLKYPVGLPTSDEIVFAGANAKTTNTTAYYYSANYFRTMTPTIYDWDNVPDVASITSAGKLELGFVGEETGIRPVIALKPGVMILPDSDGTKENPYIVK